MRSCVRLFGALLLAAVLLAVPPVPATSGVGTGGTVEAAAPTLAASPNVVPPDRVTSVTVTGRDYLVPPHAPGTDVFGGVYVFFGWVAGGNWGPSARNSNNNQGTFAVSYAYPGEGGDAETRDDGSGNLRLVSFTEGGESGNATDYHMDANGNWTTEIRVYGSTFNSTNPNTGESRTFDCQQVQCGIFTIGAHGKASITNERFTPLTFRDDAGGNDGGEGGAGGGTPPDGDSGDGSDGGNGGGDPGGAAPEGEETSVSTTTTAPPTTTTTTTTTPPTTTAAATTTSAATTSTTTRPAATVATTVDSADSDDDDEGIALEASSVDSTGGSALPMLVIGLLVAAVLVAGFLLRRWLRRRAEAVT